MIRPTALVLAVTMVACLAASSFADDVCPAPFRGNELSVYAEWGFDTDPNGQSTPPDVFDSVGDGTHQLGTCDSFVLPSPQLTWSAGALYAGDTAGLLNGQLVNFIDSYPFKYIWIQITYGGEGVPTVDYVQTATKNGELIRAFDCTDNVRVESWVLEPNPDCEQFRITVPANTYVDQLVVETVSQMLSPVEELRWTTIKALYR